MLRQIFFLNTINYCFNSQFSCLDEHKENNPHPTPASMIHLFPHHKSLTNPLIYLQ